MTAPAAEREILSQALLDGFAGRAARNDKENRSFSEDFEELKAAGYLNMAVPESMGGLGMNLSGVCQQTRRLAYHSPSTALATNMHIYWTGVAAGLLQMGDDRLSWLLEESVAGEVFAAGHSERGNDFPIFLSTTKAERVDGGYKFTGHKMFGSLAPVWTRLGLHGQTEDGKVIHAFMPRETKGYRIEETWDTLGMRATRSDDTILEGAVVEDKYIANIVDAGGADIFVLSIFAWAEPTFANIYIGLAQRAMDLGVEGLKKRSSLAVTRTMAYHPEMQHTVADMAMELESMNPHADAIAKEWSEGADHGEAWPMKLVAMKHHCVVGAKNVVDGALTLTGGSGMFKGNELERLYWNVRAGTFHPAVPALVYEIVGKTMLGIELGEQPRWG